MPGHVHMIIGSNKNKLEDIVRFIHSNATPTGDVAGKTEAVPPNVHERRCLQIKSHFDFCLISGPEVLGEK